MKNDVRARCWHGGDSLWRMKSRLDLEKPTIEFEALPLVQ